MAVINQYEVEFLKWVNPKKGITKDDLEVGDVIKILSEPLPPSGGKGVARCEILLPDGKTKRLFNFGKTVYFNECVPKWGVETKAWIGKSLTLKDKNAQMGNMTGRLFVPVD